MIIKNDTAVRNCLHIVFDAFRDGGTGMTSQQQSAWLADQKSAVRQMISDHIDSDECDIYDYEIIEDDLGKSAAPRMIVVARFDGVTKWGKRDADQTLTEARKAMQPLVKPINNVSVYIYATGTPGKLACKQAAELVEA